MFSPAYLQQLIAIADRVDAAGHGKKEAVYREGSIQLGVSVSTLKKHLKKAGLIKKRKRRADAGQSGLTLKEAQTLSAYCVHGYRKNNKKNTSLTEAVDVLRRNGEIIAGRVDEKTGEIIPLSDILQPKAMKRTIKNRHNRNIGNYGNNLRRHWKKYHIRTGATGSCGWIILTLCGLFLPRRFHPQRHSIPNRMFHFMTTPG